jgi:hypothetical protein
MTVYLAGKMRGVEKFNFPRFEAAAKDLESKGWTVLSPHRMDLEIGFDPNKTLEAQNFHIEDCVRRDVDAIIKSDAIALLPRWTTSAGATCEYYLARWLRKKIYQYPTMQEI